MVSNDNFIRVYSSKNNSNVKKGGKGLSKLKKVNSFLSVVFLCLWAITVIFTFKNGYKEYHVYTIIFILIPLLFTVISNFYISKKLKSINREFIRFLGKVLIIIALIMQLVRPDILLQLNSKASTNTNKSVKVNTNVSEPIKLSKSYNVLVARVNGNDYSSYWRNSIITESYDNDKIVNSLEIISFNKDSLEITTTIIPTSIQVKYSSKDYVDELAYAFRVGGGDNLKTTIENNFNVKLDDLILLDNANVQNFINTYLDGIDVAYSGEGVQASIDGKDVSINSLYNPSEEDINNSYSLSKEILHEIFSKNKDEFNIIKNQLLKLTNKKLAFLDNSYLVYNKLINDKKEIINTNKKIDTKDIAFTSILSSQGLENNSALELNNYSMKVYSEELLKENIFIKALLENQQNINVIDDTNENYNSYEENITTEDNNIIDNTESNNEGNTENTNDANEPSGDQTGNNTETDEDKEETSEEPDEPSGDNEGSDTTKPEDEGNGDIEQPTKPTDEGEDTTEQPGDTTETPTESPDEGEDNTETPDAPSNTNNGTNGVRRGNNKKKN